jgi:hypothetical protein
MASALVALALFLPASDDGPSRPLQGLLPASGCVKACHQHQTIRRRQRAVQKRHKAAVRWTSRRWWYVRPFNAKLERIADCESGGRWHIATGNGFYGGLQFTLATWFSVGGQGMPHLNSELEQKYRAVLLYKRRGSWADWPVCGLR